MKSKIYQIYYDDISRKMLDPGFIPLDNTNSEKPDWYEFWPILNFLNQNILEDDCWYGFLSPKFFEKTGVNSKIIHKTLFDNDKTFNVLLFSPDWDQNAYFLNSFEQGEFWHPGLRKIAQTFFDYLELKINLENLVSDIHSSVFANFIIAKKGYWQDWLSIAKKFYSFIEENENSYITTQYGRKQLPMKIFLQERLHNILLSQSKYNVLSMDPSHDYLLNKRLFLNDAHTRELLIKCNAAKSLYLKTKELDYLKDYWISRQEIIFPIRDYS